MSRHREDWRHSCGGVVAVAANAGGAAAVAESLRSFRQNWGHSATQREPCLEEKEKLRAAFDALPVGAKELLLLVIRGPGAAALNSFSFKEGRRCGEVEAPQ
ncbi:unnamed protein product [Symbiodinium sp. CCMP2592]|nr:unnamed protein product [Symbiodinium sp. CCMP2592]